MAKLKGKEPKTINKNIRLSPTEEREILAASEILGTTRCEFIRDGAIAKAREILAQSKNPAA